MRRIFRFIRTEKYGTPTILAPRAKGPHASGPARQRLGGRACTSTMDTASSRWRRIAFRTSTSKPSACSSLTSTATAAWILP